MRRELNLQEIQTASLDVLIKFDDICNKKGFKYWLFYGTLLGAIRHGGVIPWDDDIDVVMPREDFDKFVNYAKSNGAELWPYKIHDRENTSNYWYGVPRFSNMKYQLILNNWHGKCWDQGAFIDIYPFDNYGNSRREATIIYKYRKWLDRQYTWYINSISPKTGIRKYIRILLHKYMRFIKGKDYSSGVIDAVKRLLLTRTTENDKYFGVAVWGPFRVFEKERVGDVDIIGHEFCGKYFNIPKEYDYFLREMYQDYMQLPPENERQPSHDYKLYER